MTKYSYKYTNAAQRLGKLGVKKSTNTTTAAVTKKLSLSVEKEETVTEISKQDITTGKELPGATLQILDSEKNPILDENGEELYKWVSEEEPHIIVGLAPGTYYLKELIQPNGYKLSEEVKEFTVKDDGTVNKVVMTNEVYDVPSTSVTLGIEYIIVPLVTLITGLGLIGFILIKNKKAN